jgi:hypothetical protein
MKKMFVIFAAFLLTVAFFNRVAFAGPPFNNLEGVGGVAFNPLAYLAEGDSDFKIGDQAIIGKPRFGGWYVNLPDAKIDWTAFGVADTFFKRLEVSYGFETVSWVNHPTFHKNNVGAKFLVLKENAFDTKFVPAFSIGTIYKTTSSKGLATLGYPLRSTGQDWYAVVTKTISQLSVPVIISGGTLSSQEFVTGVLGFHNKRKITGFDNIDLVLPHGFVVGYEFKQGEQFASYKNNNYWDAHLAWIPNKNLTLIAAYTDTGGYGTGTRTGLGEGFVLSAQYAF